MAFRGFVINCPNCGHKLPLTADAVELQGPVQRRYFELVANNPHGLTGQMILDLAYAEDPDGGPDNLKIVKATIFCINQKLKPFGLRIHGGYGGAGARYRLTELPRAT